MGFQEDRGVQGMLNICVTRNVGKAEVNMDEIIEEKAHHDWDAY